MDHKDQHRRVKFKHRSLRPDSQWHVLQDPAVVKPVRHDGVECQRGRDGCSLKVFALAGGILGEHGDGDVEAREASQAAKDKEGQGQGIEDGTHA